MRNLDVFLRSELFVTDDITLFVEEQVLGVPSSVRVDFCLDEALVLDEVVGSKLELGCGYESDEPRLFRGIVESIAIRARAGSQAGESPAIGYTCRVVSQWGLLERSVGCQIFQDLDVKAIVTKTLEQHGIESKSLRWKLAATYPKREYCVQYQESALNFVSRLLESEGIFAYSEPDPDSEGELFCFADDSGLADPIDGKDALPLRARSGLQFGEEAITAVDHCNRLRSGKFTLQDYDFKRPALSLQAAAQATTFTDLEVYDYPGEYFEPSEGKRLAQVRLEQEQAERSTVRLQSNSARIRAGRTLVLSQLDREERYFVTRVEHRCSMRSTEMGQSVDYQVNAEAVPMTVKFRPPRIHAAPVIDGPQTARVVAPEGSKPEEIHTDEHGRAKVKFHWDLSPEVADKASCWMRVGQLQTSGSMMLPRIDWEVIVEFLEGNPDRPVITGRLYNGLLMPPYALPEGRTRTTFKSASSPGGGGNNEIRFEDKAGSEELMIASQYDTTIATANNRNRKVGKNETLVVGSNVTVNVGADQAITITNGYKCSVDGSQNISVSGDRSVKVNAVTGITVKGNSTTSVGGMQFEMNGSPLAGLIATVSARAAAAAEKKAAEAIAKIQGAVQGKIDQVMGPIKDVADKAEKMQGAMNSLKDGNLAAAGSLATSAAGMPTASALFGAVSGGPEGGAAKAPAGGDPVGLVAATNEINDSLTGALGGLADKANAAAKKAIGDAFGTSGGGGGGESMGNKGGPDGGVGGISESDAATGPGHAQYKITGSHKEDTSTARVIVTAGGVNLNVKGTMTQKVGAALIELAIGDHAETTEGAKTETQLGLVVLSKGAESETASKGAITKMVGGAQLQKINGNYSVEAATAACFIGAFHKIDAKTAITLKCGASSVVIDGSGVTIKSPLVSFAAGSMVVTKSVSDV